MDLQLNDERISVALNVGTWITFLGALLFGIGTYLLILRKFKIETTAFCSILAFGSYSFYIYFRAISFNALLHYYDNIVQSSKATIIDISELKFLSPVFIFTVALLCWFISIVTLRIDGNIIF